MKQAQAIAATKRVMPEIASLIDVVFLLLIYFLVTASLIRTEADLSFHIPFLEPDIPLTQHPLEVLVEVAEDGVVSIEGEPFAADAAGSKALIGRLTMLKASADSSRSELIVNVMPHDKTLHGQIVPVMDACAAARIQNMSFVM